MSKRDRKKRVKQKRQARPKLKGEFALAPVKHRMADGRRSRAGEMRRAKPTREVVAKRQALLGGKDGCIDDWIDVAAAQAWLTEDQTNALRKFRGVITAYQAVISAPRLGRDTLAGLQPGGAAPINDEERDRRIKNAYDDAMFALGQAHKRDAGAVEAHITGMAMPLGQSMQRIARASEWLVDHFG